MKLRTSALRLSERWFRCGCSSAALAKIGVVFVVLFAQLGDAFCQQDRCYPGMDCPNDIPGQRPSNPPPQPQVRPDVQPAPTSSAKTDCGNPQGFVAQNFVGVILGQQVERPCNLPSTHCCFEDGSSVPMMDGSRLPFASSCFTMRQLFGLPVRIDGLTCRR